METGAIFQIFDRLEHLHRSYLREFSYQVGLNLRQLESLIYLGKCNRYSNTPAALTEYLGLTKGTVSQTILSLEKKRLLRKNSDKNDGRIVHLTLTRKAEKLLKQCSANSPLECSLAGYSAKSAALGSMLLTLLTEVQRANQSRMFGACHTCAYFRRNGLGTAHQCGLTKEQLLAHESLKICREHSDVIHTD